MVIYAGLALASIVGSVILNLRVNNRMLTNLAKKGYELKKGEMPAFKKEIKDIDILNFIPLINIGYTFFHGSTKYANCEAHFANLIAQGKVERISKEKNDVLKETKPEKREKAFMSMRTREHLGLDPISTREKTGAKIARKVKAHSDKVREKEEERKTAKEDERLKSILDLLKDEDEETRRKVLEALSKKGEATDTKSTGGAHL